MEVSVVLRRSERFRESDKREMAVVVVVVMVQAVSVSTLNEDEEAVSCLVSVERGSILIA